MHYSSIQHMSRCISTHLHPERHYRVLDLGSWAYEGQTTHRDLLAGYRVSYVGVDIVPGHNVRRVMTKPYRIPVGSDSVDLLISGQVFEHIPFVWATMFEVARVLRPGGLAFIAAPSRGHTHNVHDLWRFYPDAWQALADHAGLSLLEAHTDFPPPSGDGKRHDYAAIPASRYWGDSVGVFRRPERGPGLRARLVRAVLVGWANRLGGIDGVPRPEPLPARRQPPALAGRSG
jgi:SAM-dependent methyltransferase